ncbi:MAG: alpha/beta hydrolase [Verrucomicrobia bacterium]|nr:alpha/beta hydrolase [Verrucomicrobiota bacterium]MBV8279694.1 alpha/beta hydrolase [Verrucomicrobiota bacterium]
MSHYVTIPIKANGAIDPDEQIQDIISKSVSPVFNPTDIFIYSHGWWTTTDAALKQYNLATTDLIYFLRGQGHLLNPQTSPLLIGIHWPSIIDDDPSSTLNLLEPFTFYQMQKRADDIGDEGLYTILRLILAPAHVANLRINLIGHSFGCKVVCSALQELAVKQVPIPGNVSFNVVLLQAAFTTDALDQGGPYASVIPTFGPRLRMLVSRSNLDLALRNDFPTAQRLDLFHAGVDTALGFTGPSVATVGAFANNRQVAVIRGSQFLGHEPALPPGPAIVTADLTPIHQANVGFQGGPGGHHTDIFLQEIYDLMCWFFF